MTLEHGFISEIEQLQERAKSYVEKAKRADNKSFAMQFLDLADEALARADELGDRANNYMH